LDFTGTQYTITANTDFGIHSLRFALGYPMDLPRLMSYINYVDDALGRLHHTRDWHNHGMYYQQFWAVEVIFNAEQLIEAARPNVPN